MGGKETEVHQEEEEEEAMAAHESCDAGSYFVVKPERASMVDLFKFLIATTTQNEFIESSDGEWGRAVSGDRRWVIVVSVIARKIIAACGKPMRWSGLLVEFSLNLIAQNNGLLRLLLNLLRGMVVMPRRGSDTFISAIGHLDSRLDLYSSSAYRSEDPVDDHNANKALMDLCMMASKLAYENANVVKNVVVDRWKMHFVDFYDCWNDYQKERSTQVFVLCDRAKDANLVLVSFRGTEPFDADDWCTDFDYSWYDIPELGRIHMGFLEALGLGNRAQLSTFQSSLDTTSEDRNTAYYAVRHALRTLLEEHANAKFVVTGHSLGGALAILLPAVMLLLQGERGMVERLRGVYTFGQPRVGDQSLGRFMDARLCRPVSRYVRVVYCNDLVPRLPYDDETFLFKHFGPCHYYNSCYVEQTVEEEPNKNYYGLAYIIPEYLNAVWELIRSFIMGWRYGTQYREGWFSVFLRICGLAMPGVSAHSPRDYVNCIRLGRRETVIAQ